MTEYLFTEPSYISGYLILDAGLPLLSQHIRLWTLEDQTAA